MFDQSYQLFWHPLFFLFLEDYMIFTMSGSYQWYMLVQIFLTLKREQLRKIMRIFMQDVFYKVIMPKIDVFSQ